jgi:hypothetical protein
MALEVVPVANAAAANACAVSAAVVCVDFAAAAICPLVAFPSRQRRRRFCTGSQVGRIFLPLFCVVRPALLLVVVNPVLRYRRQLKRLFSSALLLVFLDRVSLARQLTALYFENNNMCMTLSGSRLLDEMGSKARLAVPMSVRLVLSLFLQSEACTAFSKLSDHRCIMHNCSIKASHGGCIRSLY